MKLKHIAIIGTLFPILFSLVLFFGVLISADSDDENSNLSSGASDKKATQPAQPVHRQNVEKVVSQETRQNYTKDRRTKVQQTQSVQKNQQTTEKTRNLVTKKGQKKK